jgi:hypothetical protein
MYIIGKMTPVETIPRMREGEVKENGGWVNSSIVTGVQRSGLPQLPSHRSLQSTGIEKCLRCCITKSFTR